MSTLIKHLRKLSKDEKTAYYYDIVGEHQHESVTISKISTVNWAFRHEVRCW